MEHIINAILNKQVIIVAEGNSIMAVCFESQSQFGYYASHSTANNNSTLLVSAKNQLNEYIAGSRKVFDIKFKLQGTDFQELVWNEIEKIAYGQVRSYLEIANKIARPGAYRAVANAVGKNPISIIIPCHRVIRSNGDLGGYSGGIEIKKQLLSNEANHFKN